MEFVKLLLSTTLMFQSETVPTDDAVAIAADTQTSQLGTNPARISGERRLDVETEALILDPSITSGTFDATFKPVARYGILDEFELGIGLLKREEIQNPYNLRPAKLPRNLNVDPANSKLGAGVSTKF